MTNALMMVAYVVHSTFVFPRLTALESMKVTHYPERLLELAPGASLRVNASCCVVGKDVLAQFEVQWRGPRGQRPHMLVNMFARNASQNNLVVYSEGRRLCAATMRTRQVGADTVVDLHMTAPRAVCCRVQNAIACLRSKALALPWRRPRWSDDRLTRWRLAVFKRDVARPVACESGGACSLPE